MSKYSEECSYLYCKEVHTIAISKAHPTHNKFIISSLPYFHYFNNCNMKHSSPQQFRFCRLHGNPLLRIRLLILVAVSIACLAIPAHHVNAAAGSTRALLADKTVKGKVTDTSNNEGLPGVNVVVKGTSVGTTTDARGEYSINVPDNSAVLVFSFVGYLSQEVAVGNRTTIDLRLAPDTKTLSEVVVIGYGTVRKSDLTGAVSGVKEAELMERPAPSLNQMMAGRMAGVQVNNNSGRPGGRTTVRIRGFSSINSSNNPLYVVDGVLLPQSTGDQFSNAIDFINPNDIVSVEVLKDASSTAIYGARGANGVILVTTRKGKAGESRITYDTQLSVNTIGPNKPQVLNAEQYLAVEELSYANIQKYDPAGWASGKYANLDPIRRRREYNAKYPGIFREEGGNSSPTTTPTGSRSRARTSSRRTISWVSAVATSGLSIPSRWATATTRV